MNNKKSFSDRNSKEGYQSLLNKNTINKDTIIKISVEDITKIVNAFNDQNIPVEAIIEEIEMNYKNLKK